MGRSKRTSNQLKNRQSKKRTFKRLVKKENGQRRRRKRLMLRIVNSPVNDNGPKMKRVVQSNAPHGKQINDQNTDSIETDIFLKTSNNSQIRKTRLRKSQTDKLHQKWVRFPKKGRSKGNKHLKRNKRVLQHPLLLDQAVDAAFKKSPDKLQNSTECFSEKQNYLNSVTEIDTIISEKPMKLQTVAEQTVEAQIATRVNETLQIMKPNESIDAMANETINEPVVFNENEIINQVSQNISNTTLRPESDEDFTDRPFLEFVRSYIAEVYSGDIIFFDEIFGQQCSPDFLPFVSDNAEKKSSIESFVTQSAKKKLEENNKNSYDPNAKDQKEDQRQNPRRIVIIDGSNVAFSYTRCKEFSVEGLKICIDYFIKLGHEVKAVVPQMHLRRQNSSDPAALNKLCKDGFIVLTPSKNLPEKMSSRYEDRIILQLAAIHDGVVISNNNYRDLIDESPAIKKVIFNRVIPYCWDNDIFVLPADPYGKHGPKLHELLNRKPKP